MIRAIILSELGSLWGGGGDGPKGPISPIKLLQSMVLHFAGRPAQLGRWLKCPSGVCFWVKSAYLVSAGPWLGQHLRALAWLGPAQRAGPDQLAGRSRASLAPNDRLTSQLALAGPALRG